MISTLLLLIGRIPSLFNSPIYDRILWEAATRPSYGKGYQCLSPEIDLTRTTDFATRKKWLSSKVKCVMDSNYTTNPFSDTNEREAFLALTSVIGRHTDDIANSLVPMLEEWQEAVGNTPYTFAITTK